jgi:hypothetical protein
MSQIVSATPEGGVSDYSYKAKDRIEALVRSLRTMVERNPEQEVRGQAVISPEAIEDGEPIRAADALLVAEQLDAAIGPWPGPTAATASHRDLRPWCAVPAGFLSFVAVNER